jgi:hypothetical protein
MLGDGLEPRLLFAQGRGVDRHHQSPGLVLADVDLGARRATNEARYLLQAFRTDDHEQTSHMCGHGHKAPCGWIV